jgi:hypothetical protein
VFTMERFGCSRWRDARTNAADPFADHHHAQEART